MYRVSTKTKVTNWKHGFQNRQDTETRIFRIGADRVDIIKQAL